MCPWIAYVVLAWLCIFSPNLDAAGLPQFRFLQPGEAARWQASHDVGALAETAEGMRIPISGDDPFIDGPVAEFETSAPLHLRIRLKSTEGGLAQLFWYTEGPDEEHSVWFKVRTNEWTDLCLPLPAIASGSRLRFDPPGNQGTCTIAWFLFEDSTHPGIQKITADADKIDLSYRGLTGETDFAELPAHGASADSLSPHVVHRAVLNGDGQFTIPRFDTQGGVARDRLYSRFIALQRDAKFGMVPIGPERYVEEFNHVSKYVTTFPVTTSKKGLQVQMLDDALKLRVQHAALNVSLTGIVDLARAPSSLKWQMDGETYHFHRHAIEGIPVKSLSDTECVVALILLATKSGDPNIDSIMLHPDRATIPNGITAFNTVTADGLKYYKACLEFLADRFSRPDAEFGRVSNYIVGNEVNSHWEWYNMGPAPRDLVVEDYERSVRIANAAVRKFSSSARVYLSLEHHWNISYTKDQRRSLTGRYLIEAFNRRSQLGGDFDWNLAFHPYPENLFEPRTWRDKTAQHHPNTPRITFKNLEQLTAFFTQSEMLRRGKQRRIILSEQGFHSDDTEAGDLAQAAGYCYAWQKVNRMDGIDSLILHRHVDHSQEGGLNLGLWRRKPDSIADPSTPRPMYTVFEKADTAEWKDAFHFALPIIGVNDWDEIHSQK